MGKKYLNLIYSLYSCNSSLIKSCKIAVFGNFKTELIFANDGNVDTSRELIFVN